MYRLTCCLGVPTKIGFSIPYLKVQIAGLGIPGKQLSFDLLVRGPSEMVSYPILQVCVQLTKALGSCPLWYVQNFLEPY